MVRGRSCWWPGSSSSAESVALIEGSAGLIACLRCHLVA